VELPGIEPDTKPQVSCGNAGFDDAKGRETTRRDLRIHRTVLTRQQIKWNCGHNSDGRHVHFIRMAFDSELFRKT
jgi:hypothetical protein